MTDSKSIYQDTTGVTNGQYLVYVLYRDGTIPHYVGATIDSRRPYSNQHHARTDYNVTSVEIVQECMTLEDASKLEDQLINRYGRQVEGGTLVNVQGGGHGLTPHSEETKLKIGQANKGRPSPNKGKPMSDEQKDKISQTLKGRPRTDETKRKISLSQRGIPKSDEHKAKLIGRTHTDETKAKLKAAWARRKESSLK